MSIAFMLIASDYLYVAHLIALIFWRQCGIYISLGICETHNFQPTVARDAQGRKQRAMAIQSNETPNWPTGSVVSAEAAILMMADTGTILYSKNIHQKEYPASTTKILTTLIATANR